MIIFLSLIILIRTHIQCTFAFTFTYRTPHTHIQDFKGGVNEMDTGGSTHEVTEPGTSKFVVYLLPIAIVLILAFFWQYNE